MVPGLITVKGEKPIVHYSSKSGAWYQSRISFSTEERNSWCVINEQCFPQPTGRFSNLSLPELLILVDTLDQLPFLNTLSSGGYWKSTPSSCTTLNIPLTFILWLVILIWLFQNVICILMIHKWYLQPDSSPELQSHKFTVFSIFQLRCLRNILTLS